MLASEKLLEEAWEYSRDKALRAYFLKHLLEEKNHAQWLAEDLDKLGVEKVFDYRAAMLAGTQYYLIYHRDPALLLGYMRALESWPKPLDVVDKLEAKYGQLKTLRYHAEHDPQHTKEIEAVISTLSPELQTAIEQNRMFVVAYVQAIAQTFDTEDL